MEQDAIADKLIDRAAYIRDLIESELEGNTPDLVRVSISLGIIEAAWTGKGEQQWPANFQVQSDSPRQTKCFAT